LAYGHVEIVSEYHGVGLRGGEFVQSPRLRADRCRHAAGHAHRRFRPECLSRLRQVLEFTGAGSLS
jgi:hypothetical protein